MLSKRNMTIIILFLILSTVVSLIIFFLVRNNKKNEKYEQNDMLSVRIARPSCPYLPAENKEYMSSSSTCYIPGSTDMAANINDAQIRCCKDNCQGIRYNKNTRQVCLQYGVDKNNSNISTSSITYLKK